ncbi:MAG: transpeptidase family protein [Chitinophagaceae bacterium]|nr:transpeptidase family protein [Chitinophagaceae bacterium]
MDVKKDILWRVYLCFLGIIMLGFVVLGRAFYIQRVQGTYWKKMSDSTHSKYVAVNAERGSIYSEDGNMLSTSIPVFDVYVDFAADGLRENDGKRFFENLDSLSTSLSNLFKDASPESYKKQLKLAYQNEDRYYPLKKKITFEQYTQLRDFSLVKQGRNKSGFLIDIRDNRVNPYVLLANRTIGLSRGDTSKNVGLERTYDSLLKGQEGKRLMRYMAGAYVPVDGAEIAPESGKDIITTLDTYMQDVSENALMKMMVANNSLHGTCIVMETATGKIKAIANLGKRPDGSYLEDYNYGIATKTEPGSIFKVATLLSLLEDKYVDTGTIVNCEGGKKSFYGLNITDSHLGTGNVTVKEAFAMSSNVAFAKLAEQYYHNQPLQFYNHLHALRLDTATGVDIIGQATPLIKKPGGKFWGKTTLPFMAHGYEELVTPLHMLMVYNAVANHGRMMKPYLVNAVREMGVEIKTFKPQVLVEKICSDETLGKLKDCMLDVVESAHGTANKLKTPLYSFAGKTGTAVTAMDNRGYNKASKIYQSAFIGFFPFDKPMYTIAVVIQNSSESKLAYGGVVSGPVFREVADKIYACDLANQPYYTATRERDSLPYNYYGIKADISKILSAFDLPYTDSASAGYWRNVYMYNDNTTLTQAYDPARLNGKVPKVVGMGLKDAVCLLENMGLHVVASGRGKVMYQSIIADANYLKGQTINIQLN